MRDYIILNGINSNTITGLLISTLPPITKPKIRTQKEEIDGRDGDIITKLGYSAYDKEFTIGLYGNFDINEVIAYFNSEGTVVFSNENDKYYNYQILEQIDFEKLIRFKTAKVKMHVQPFKYPTEEEQIQVDATVIQQEGTNLKLEYTSVDQLIETTIKGNTYQETTTGKNIAGVSSVTSNLSIQDDVITLASGSTGSNFVNFEAVTLEANTEYKFEIFIKGTPTNDATSEFVLKDTNNNNIFDLYRKIKNNITETFTPTSSVTLYRLNIYNTSSTPTTSAVSFQLQIRKANTSEGYEPYTGGNPAPNPDYPQEVQVVTGDNQIDISNKNLFDESLITNAIGWTYSNGYYTGLMSDLRTYNRDNPIFSNFKENTRYAFSWEGYLGTVTNPKIQFVYTDGTTYSGATITSTTSTRYSVTSGANKTIQKIMFDYGTNGTIFIKDIQLEETSSATTYVEHKEQNYPISLGNIELCKTPDYQDYIHKNNGKWYVHKEIGKYVSNGSESGWNIANSGTANYSYRLTINGQINTTSWLSNKYSLTTLINASTTNEGIFLLNSQATKWEIRIRYGAEQTLENFKASLSSTNLNIYYILNTPTETEITDTTLISQLEALAGATTYETTTNISVTGDELLPILNVKTQGMPNTIVENIGNIYAKPLLTIYGSGDIGVYLNKIQVLQIALGDNGSITIDVSKMEAYNATTQALLNRLVTGDYMNVLINSGENEIAFSGNVLGFTMDNYTRWL